MLQIRCLSLSSKFNPLQQPGSLRTCPWQLTQAHGSPSKKSSIKFSSKSSFYSANKRIFRQSIEEGIINNRIHKPINKLCHPLAIKDDYGLQSEDSPSLLDVFKKKLAAIGHFTRFYVQISNIAAATSFCFLPLQSFSQVTPTFLMGVLKAIVLSVLPVVFISTFNQICDVEIDKINKPYLPLVSGDLAMPTGIAICVGSALVSIAFGVMSGSPALLWAAILQVITGVAYSAPHPFLRWKSHTFLAPFSVVILATLLFIGCFIHSQKYVLGGPFIATRPFIFATTILSIYSFANGLLKDLTDEEGDKEFRMQTFCVLFGKEKMLSFCVNLMLLCYGGAIITGAFASSMTNKLVTIIGHSILALMLWRQSKKVHLDEFESTFGFYMSFWKLTRIEFILLHFLR